MSRSKKKNAMDWTIPDKEMLEALREPWTALRSDRDLPPDVLANCARREPLAALRSDRELPPEIEDWCRVVTELDTSSDATKGVSD